MTSLGTDTVSVDGNISNILLQDSTMVFSFTSVGKYIALKILLQVCLENVYLKYILRLCAPLLEEEEDNIYLSIDGVREEGVLREPPPLPPQSAARSSCSLAAASAIWTRRTCSPGSELSSTVSHCSEVLMFNIKF